MASPPEIPEGTKVIERKRASGDIEYVVRKDPSYAKTDCWIATAYFGDPYHPNVELLRAFRDRQSSHKWLRWIVRPSSVIA